MTKFKVGDKVRLAGTGWDDRLIKYNTGGAGGTSVVAEVDANGLSGRLEDGYFFRSEGMFAVELEEAFAPKRKALDEAFKALGTPIEYDDIRKGDVYAKRYEDGLFVLFTNRDAANKGYEYRLIYRPEPVKVEAPTKLGAVVRYAGGLLMTRTERGFFSQNGIPHSDEHVSRGLTVGAAKVLFEGVDDE